MNARSSMPCFKCSDCCSGRSAECQNANPAPSARRPGRVTFPVPPSAPLQSCRSCGAAVFWILTSGGKRMPVDAESHESHFATCPNAATHRKPKVRA